MAAGEALKDIALKFQMSWLQVRVCPCSGRRTRGTATVNVMNPSSYHHRSVPVLWAPHPLPLLRLLLCVFCCRLGCARAVGVEPAAPGRGCSPRDRLAVGAARLCCCWGWFIFMLLLLLLLLLSC